MCPSFDGSVLTDFEKYEKITWLPLIVHESKRCTTGSRISSWTSCKISDSLSWSIYKDSISDRESDSWEESMLRIIPLLQLRGILKYYICTIFEDSYIKFKTSTINDTKDSFYFPLDCKMPHFSIKISSKKNFQPKFLYLVTQLSLSYPTPYPRHYLCRWTMTRSQISN